MVPPLYDANAHCTHTYSFFQRKSFSRRYVSQEHTAFMHTHWKHWKINIEHDQAQFVFWGKKNKKKPPTNSLSYNRLFFCFCFFNPHLIRVLSERILCLTPHLSDMAGLPLLILAPVWMCMGSVKLLWTIMRPFGGCKDWSGEDRGSGAHIALFVLQI